ncbi:MAG: HAMP domain-containing sensor histidine kinase [Steroidobacteraceae bacterium]
MLKKFFSKSRIQTDRSRAVFVLIALAGVLPSALVLWFTSLAIRNEQLATARIAEESQQVLLRQIKSDLVSSWSTLLNEIDRRIASQPPAVAFYAAITEGGADGLIVFTGDDVRRVAYPGLPKRADDVSSSPMALSASGVPGKSENQLPARIKGDDFNSELASKFSVLTAAIQRDDRDTARRAAKNLLDSTDFDLCVDNGGRHTLSSIELFILENRQVVSDSIYESVLSRLTQRLNNYRFYLIPASQRRFLMGRVAELAAQTSAPASIFPTLPAEALSAQFMEENTDLIAGPDLNRSSIEDVWQQRLPGGRGIVLFTEHKIRKLYEQWLAAMDNPLAARVHVEVISDNNTPQLAGAEILLGTAFPGWRLRVVEAHADTRSLSGIYVALSVVSVCLILVVLIVIASMTLRRLALAQQKNTMVATVSHELKTPVSSIKLLVDTLLQDSVLRPDRVREYLQLISRENLRLSQVIENVLSFSRIERTKFRIERRRLDIADIIREAMATFSQQAEITGREVSVDMAPDIPPYYGDAWALNRVMLNLLDNAYKYSDPPRQISVSVQVEKQSIIISVSDRGVGISEADLGKIFGQFFQADQKLSRNNEGCGLGLGIVQHIVQLHDGTIDVSSKLGVGSVFTIHLPIK